MTPVLACPDQHWDDTNFSIESHENVFSIVAMHQFVIFLRILTTSRNSLYFFFLLQVPPFKFRVLKIKFMYAGKWHFIREPLLRKLAMLLMGFFVDWKPLPHIKCKCLRMHNYPSLNTHQYRFICFMIPNIMNASTCTDFIQIRRKR